MLDVQIVEEERSYDDIQTLKVLHNGKLIFELSDCMEPEDVSFGRDLSDIPDIIEKVYKLGLIDGRLGETVYEDVKGEKQ